MKNINIERFMETEYHYLVDPKYAQKTPFGTFYHHPDFSTRYDANQLINCALDSKGVRDLLEDLDTRYAPIHLNFKKITSSDKNTVEVLRKELPERGWQAKENFILVHQKDSIKKANPKITIKEFEADDHRDADIIQKGDGGYPFHKSQDARVGGKNVVAYFEGKPIAMAGWYVHKGIVRSRKVKTLERFRGQGAASSIIIFNQNHPEILKQDAYTIFCAEDGPMKLYEDLGFIKMHTYWEFLLVTTAK